jgi:hypothetical protein
MRKTKLAVLSNAPKIDDASTRKPVVFASGGNNLVTKNELNLS